MFAATLASRIAHNKEDGDIRAIFTILFPNRILDIRFFLVVDGHSTKGAVERHQWNSVDLLSVAEKAFCKSHFGYIGLVNSRVRHSLCFAFSFVLRSWAISIRLLLCKYFKADEKLPHLSLNEGTRLHTIVHTMHRVMENLTSTHRRRVIAEMTPVWMT